MNLLNSVNEKDRGIAITHGVHKMRKCFRCGVWVAPELFKEHCVGPLDKMNDKPNRNKSFFTLNLYLIYFALGCGVFWFRFFRDGPGIYFQNRKIHGVSFSERMGIKKTIHIGPWEVWGLKSLTFFS